MSTISIQETSAANAPRSVLSLWNHVLSFFHAIGCASGLTFNP